MQGKAEDADGLTPAKDDNAALRALYHRAFAWNSDDCYKTASRAGCHGLPYSASLNPIPHTDSIHSPAPASRSFLRRLLM